MYFIGFGVSNGNEIYTNIASRIFDRECLVPEESYHLTLSYLGPLDKNIITSIDSRLPKNVSINTYSVSIGHLKIGPETHNILILEDPNGAIYNTRKYVENMISEYGIDIPKFIVPHVTLAVDCGENEIKLSNPVEVHLQGIYMYETIGKRKYKILGRN